MKIFIDSLITYFPKHSGLFDQNSDMLLRFKRGWSYEQKHFKDQLKKKLHEIIEGQTLLCTVPSSNPNKINSITIVASQICKEMPLLEDGTQCIIKRYATPRLNAGLKLNLELFQKSFHFSERLKGSHVILLDDVSTTGYSMTFLSKELLDFGATSVYCLAIAKSKLVV